MLLVDRVVLARWSSPQEQLVQLMTSPGSCHDGIGVLYIFGVCNRSTCLPIVENRESQRGKAQERRSEEEEEEEERRTLRVHDYEDARMHRGASFQHPRNSIVINREMVAISGLMD